MERYKKLEIVVDTTLDAADKALLFDQLALGTAEMVRRGGEVILWADTPEAEDVVINSVIKKNKDLKVKRLPKRWAETTDLEAEGTLSLDGTKKLVEVDSLDKVKVHTPLQKKQAYRLRCNCGVS